jgi:prepilin-type processing-associated H-X9-DG protein
LLAVNTQHNFSQIKDGLSNTLAVVESAGRPYLYQKGVSKGNTISPQASAIGVNGGGWARPASDFSFGAASKDGTQTGPTLASLTGAVAINATNGGEALSQYDTAAGTPNYFVYGSSQPYSFHTAGANVLFGDGRVQLISNEVTVPVFAALVTVSGSTAEAITRGQY